MILRANFLVALVPIIALATCHTPQKKEPEKPNIILIMADDLGQETIGAYGGESYPTPHLDRLAAEGMQFQNCYSTPLCTPSRVQLMTGKYNFRNYIGFGLLDPKERTFANALQDAGYKTCVVGKWQLYGNEKQQKLAGGKVGTLPRKAGFDTYRLWQVKDRGERYKNPMLETFENGVETFEGAYGADKFVDFIESFMTKNKENPFFVYFPMCLVHAPFTPTPDSPDYETLGSKSDLNDTTYFYDMMEYMDKQVGRIVEKVNELKIRENTIILFIGDNGTDRRIISKWKGQSIRGGKGTTLETGTHVPFIANWKSKISPGTVNENLVDFTDFYPTLLDIGRAENPYGQSTDGVSFYGQLIGKPAKARDWVFCHYDPRWSNFPSKRYVHNKEWKLYESGDFYNFQNDPAEINHLNDETLTTEQLKLKKAFQKVLDEMKNK